MDELAAIVRHLIEQRERLDKAIAALQSVTKGRRSLSAAGRARIAAAQRARWAKIKAKAKKRA